jgi:hypothetical protein
MKTDANKLKIVGIASLMGTREFEGKLWLPLENVQKMLELIAEML